jgi:hypothetical protein
MWRIYRLPGSRDWWLIDHGKGTPIFKVLSFQCLGSCTQSVNDGMDGMQPRSWIEAFGELHIDEANKKAFFV